MTATYPGAINSALLTVQLETATPGTYAASCTINAGRSFSKTAQTVATVLPRCDDPTQPGKTVRIAVSTDSTISGDGILDGADAKTWHDRVGQTVNCKVLVGTTTGYLTVTGPYIIEGFTITGSGDGNMVTAQITMSQADDVTATAHA